MTTLTVPADRLGDIVRPGDRITHLGALPVGPRVVSGRYADGRIPLVNDRPGSEVEDYVYPGSLAGWDITVERDEPQPEPAPAPKKPRKPVTRTIDGLRLVSQGDSTWRTEDGRYEVRRGSGSWYLCDTPHPIHLPDGSWGYCWGGDAEHQYADEWIVWDTQTDDYLSRNPEGAPTLREAVAKLPTEYRKA